MVSDHCFSHIIHSFLISDSLDFMIFDFPGDGRFGVEWLILSEILSGVFDLFTLIKNAIDFLK